MLGGRAPPRMSPSEQSSRVRAGATKVARRQSSRVHSGTGDAESQRGSSLGSRAKEAERSEPSWETKPRGPIRGGPRREGPSRGGPSQRGRSVGAEQTNEQTDQRQESERKVRAVECWSNRALEMLRARTAGQHRTRQAKECQNNQAHRREAIYYQKYK